MSTHRNTPFLSVCLAIGAVLASGAALPESDIVSDLAPPPPRAETLPRSREGSVWSPGHWEWTGRSYLWVAGMWVLERRGARWVAGQWNQVGAQWHYHRGHYER